jgi:tetratricopeptide (TPR) repeat protein
MDPAQLTELEAAVEADPGAPGFAALAESHRRAGRAREALEVARRGLEQSPDAADAHLVLALVLLDQGRESDARHPLERVVAERLAAAGFSFESKGGGDLSDGGPSDAELDVAFHQAETDRDQLITPNRVAEEAVERVDAGAAEGLDEGMLGPGSAFATATMAELLARQGDEAGAQRIRAALVPPAPTGEVARTPAPGRRGTDRERRIATLERWLANIRGDLS